MRIHALLMSVALAGCGAPPTALPPAPDDGGGSAAGEGPTEPNWSPQVINAGIASPADLAAAAIATAGPRPLDPLDSPDLPPSPAAVLVHVGDPDGEPAAGVRVRLGAAGRTTDDAGNARFLSVDPGRHVLDLHAEGYAQQVRFIDAGDGDELRVILTLHRRSAPQPVDAAAGGVAVDGALTLAFEAGGLRDVAGDIHEGQAQVALTVFGAEPEDDMRGYPAPLVGEGLDGRETALETFGAFEAEVLDERGRPLTVAEGHVVEARLPVPEGAGLIVGDIIPMWTLDPASGTWREEPGTVAEVVSTAHGLEMVALLPHLSIWNFDYKGISCCFRISIAPGGRQVADFMVEIEGPALRTRRRPVDTDILVIGLRCGEYTVRLFLNGQLLDEEVLIPSEMGASGGFGCPNDAPTALLEANGDRVPNQDFGGGPGGAEVVIMAGTCPARDVEIVVEDPEGETRWTTTMDSSYFLMTRMAAGLWTIIANDPDTGDEISRTGVQITSGSVRTELQVSGAYAAPPPGGCRAAPCRGDECRSCVEVTLQDFAGNPLAGADVSFFDPINIAAPTNGAGQVCANAPRGADREMTVLPEGALPVAVTLPRSAQCASGGCARRTVVLASESQPCPEGTARAMGESRRMGLRDPGYTPVDSFRAPFEPGPGTLRVRSTGGSGPLKDLLEEEQLILGGPFGFVQWLQDDRGREAQGATHFRAEIQGVAGVGFAFDTTAHPLTLGDHDLGTGPGQLPLEVRIAWLPSMNQVDRYEASGGTASVRENAYGRLMVDFDVRLAAADGDAPDVELEGTWWAKLLTQADTPNGLFMQRSHHLNGTSVRVLSEADPEGVVYGPAGQWSATPSWPEGELQYCVPDEGWFMVVGEAWPGALRPFTPLYGLRDLVLVPWNNPSPLGAQYASPRARWWDRTFIEALYQAHGLGHVDLDEVATIYGTVMRLVDGEVEFVQAAQGATLSAQGEPTLTALRVGDDFGLADEPGEGAQFVFLNVPPRPADSPYLLEVLDETGQVMPGYSQWVAPVAGGVLVPHH